MEGWRGERKGGGVRGRMDGKDGGVRGMWRGEWEDGGVSRRMDGEDGGGGWRVEGEDG